MFSKTIAFLLIRLNQSKHLMTWFYHNYRRSYIQLCWHSITSLWQAHVAKTWPILVLNIFERLISPNRILKLQVVSYFPFLNHRSVFCFLLLSSFFIFLHPVIPASKVFIHCSVRLKPLLIYSIQTAWLSQEIVSKTTRVGKTWLPWYDLTMIIPWSWRNMVMIMPW